MTTAQEYFTAHQTAVAAIEAVMAQVKQINRDGEKAAQKAFDAACSPQAKKAAQKVAMAPYRARIDALNATIDGAEAPALWKQYCSAHDAEKAAQYR